MVVDASALVAILLYEGEAETLLAALARGGPKRLSAATLVEAGNVMHLRRGAVGDADLDALVAHFGIEIVPFDAAQAALARDAFRRFGKGIDRAGLNFGDCFSYALARLLGEPLLFVGNDFARMDITSAL